jgi:hypothetical protein
VGLFDMEAVYGVLPIILDVILHVVVFLESRKKCKKHLTGFLRRAEKWPESRRRRLSG